MDKPVGSVIYTQLCNESGGIEADLTITRLGENHFYIVTGVGFGVHDSDWIRRHLPKDGSAILIDVTSGYAVINICGPKARDVLSTVCENDVSNSAFPFACHRNIIIGAAPVRAIRIGYVGELGWELHIPTEFAVHVYDLLWQAGDKYSICDIGYRAINSLRMEKGYLYWSADITPDYTPVEAGLGFRVHLKSDGNFIGRDVLEQQKNHSLEKQLCCFTSSDDLPLYGGESILHDGKIVSLVTSAAFGHTIGHTILYGYLPTSLAGNSNFTLQAFGKSHQIQKVDAPLYDPENQRLKC
jgi:4-methylaminobutanoate oxidase (formaldehyde-forming)